MSRYQRRIPEVNEAVIATYLAGGNTRRIRGALQPLLKAAPLSKSAVSRVIATLKGGLEAWRTRSLTDLEDAALVLLLSLVASGQIKLRKIDGWEKIGAVLNQHTAMAA